MRLTDEKVREIRDRARSRRDARTVHLADCALGSPQIATSPEEEEECREALALIDALEANPPSDADVLAVYAEAEGMLRLCNQALRYNRTALDDALTARIRIGEMLHARKATKP